MSDKPVDLAFDGGRRLVTIVLRGVWNMAQVARYDAEVRELVGRILKVNPDLHFNVLVDVSEHGVQTREVTEALQGVIAGLRQGVDRVALVVSHSAIQKMQATRLAHGLTIGVFDSRADADKWLFK